MKPGNKPLLLGVVAGTAGRLPCFKFLAPDGRAVDATPSELSALPWLRLLDAYDQRLINARARQWRRAAGGQEVLP
jgi:hypothetical protein